ncbi:MAG TPA: type VI secretion system baseplate subunit TssG [Bryobacteraceae bacterium]|nr:type VI secretion system baseplate subunit TssG [Bryobacteraceae bacterium]
MITMPDLSRPQYGYRHSLDSALQVLYAAGLGPDRITIRMDGRGMPLNSVVAQEPKPGTPLSPDGRISLAIAGTGVFHALPVGMWDRGTEAEPGTAEIVELFDDPLNKARHWVREGSRLFDIAPDNLPACERWIALFGIRARDWPESLWYSLSLLLPTLHRLAGRVEGIRNALGLLLELPLKTIGRRSSWAMLPPDQTSRLGGRYGRLSLDLVAGDRKEDIARSAIVIGPVTLAVWRQYREPQNQALLREVFRICVPIHSQYEVAWTVLDPTAPVCLGRADENSILGVNSWFGTSRAVAGVAYD